MTDIDKMPAMCHDCAYWEVCEYPYVCPIELSNNSPGLSNNPTELSDNSIEVFVKGKRDTISRQAAIDAVDEQVKYCDKALTSFDISLKDEYAVKVEKASLNALKETLEYLPSAQPERKTEKALRLLVEWAVECGFGYDNIPEEYEKHKDEIQDMGYIEGLIYIAENEVEHE